MTAALSIVPAACSSISRSRLEGRYVTLDDTISGFEALLGGELDQYPEAAFSMVGTVDEVHKKAKDMGAL